MSISSDKLPRSMAFPKLFKRASDGSIQEWKISVIENNITTEYGKVGGAIQTATDIIKEGKNIGKKNETTPFEQACAEAAAKHEKQRKTKGYVDSMEKAILNERDELVEGGIDPMLAHKWRDHSKKITFPALVQPKFDGIRCIAVVKDGKCSLWSRTRKPITGVPHIVKAIEALPCALWGDSFVLDGELYNHELKKDFEKITSFVRQEVPQPGHEIVQYHIYDCTFPELKTGWMPPQFHSRDLWLVGALITPGKFLHRVETLPVNSEDEVLEYFGDCLARGYEGCMVRNRDSVYENKRSYNLQKVKEMEDREFPIVSVEQGRGKMAGLAIFVCKADNGDLFNVKMKGSLDNLRQYVVQPSLAVGKQLTVQYQNLSAYGIPRFGVGLRIRDPSL